MNTYQKYPGTPHLPWSQAVTEDDVRVQSVSIFERSEVVVTEKMDGENTTLYNDYLHARSLDSRNHLSRNWVKQWHASIASDIPPQWRICGENLYARHSVAYDDLVSYFYGFSVWNDQGQCCDWDETLYWFSLLGIQPVPVLYRGVWNEKIIRDITVDTSKQEGYVVRTVAAFAYDKFDQHIAKWVRKGHVQTDKHWMHQELIPNKLKNQ